MPHRLRSSPLLISILLTLLIFSLSCASLNQPRQTEDGLTHVRSRVPGTVAFSEVLHVDGYDNLMPYKIGLDYAPGQKPLSPEDEQRIYDMLQEMMISDIRGREQLVRDADACTLKVSLYVVDLEIHEPVATGSYTSFVNSYGAATFVTEMRDSLTDEPVLRYGQRRELGGGAGPAGPNPGLDRLEKVLHQAAFEAGQMILEARPTLESQIHSREHLGCTGRLGKLRQAARAG